MSGPRLNWAGNRTYAAAAVHRPASVDEVRDLVRRVPRLKALGTRHCFNDIADTSGDQVSLERLDRIASLDHAARTVTIEAGVRYGELGRLLHEAGCALHNLASLPHISVVGACATATHGSGDRHGNLATAVVALEMVSADGELVTLSRASDPRLFSAAVVGLGALGIVTRLTLRIEPSYDVRQDLVEGLTFQAFESNFDAITAAADSVSLFTDWRAERFHQVWLKRRVVPGQVSARPEAFFGAVAAGCDRHPIPGHAAENCTPQLGVAGPWHERWPHFRLEFTPSSGAELQSEYFVPRRHAVPALRVLAGLRDRIAPLVLVTEVRTIAADDLWLSPCHEQASVAFHFTWKPDWPAVRAVLPVIEAGLAPAGVRPHWGKLFTMDAATLRDRFPRIPDFLALRRQLDPDGRFLNRYLTACFGE